VNRAGADDDQQAIVFAMHNTLDVFARLGNQFFHRRAGNGEKANQMFWRREHGDVLDTLVVGLTCLLNVAWITAVRFHGLVLKFEKMFLEIGKKKPPGSRRLVWEFRSFRVRSDLSTAGKA
jgi:hypothetical protein